MIDAQRDARGSQIFGTRRKHGRTHKPVPSATCIPDKPTSVMVPQELSRCPISAIIHSRGRHPILAYPGSARASAEVPGRGATNSNSRSFALVLIVLGYNGCGTEKATRDVMNVWRNCKTRTEARYSGRRLT